MVLTSAAHALELDVMKEEEEEETAVWRVGIKGNHDQPYHQGY